MGFVPRVLVVMKGELFIYGRNLKENVVTIIFKTGKNYGQKKIADPLYREGERHSGKQHVLKVHIYIFFWGTHENVTLKMY